MDRFDARLLLSDTRELVVDRSTSPSQHHHVAHLAHELDALRYADMHTATHDDDDPPPLPPDDPPSQGGVYGAVGLMYDEEGAGDPPQDGDAPPLPPVAVDDGPFVPRFAIPPSIREIPTTRRQHKVVVGG